LSPDLIWPCSLVFLHSYLDALSVRVLVSGLIFHGVIGVVMKFIASAGTMVWISIIGE